MPTQTARPSLVVCYRQHVLRDVAFFRAYLLWPELDPVGNRFNGFIKGVQLAIADAAESVDHLVKSEEAIRIAMARQ
jgi:hypothetical protein